MARLNALFPAKIALHNQEDFDLAPYSQGLRDSIRFSVFQHLMSDSICSKQQQDSIRMRILNWCDIPRYSQAWDSLNRYSEETKKLEDVCLETLHAIECQQPTGFTGALTPRSSEDATLETTKIPRVRFPPIESSCQSPLHDASFSHYDYSVQRLPFAPPVPNPLLKGMPGREISGAKTDAAAFAGDHSAPAILVYPHDLSTTEFFEHPLARELKMTSAEKAQLGLIVPKQLSSRNF